MGAEMSCVLRVTGDFDVDSFLAESSLLACSVWRRGEKSVGRIGFSTTSGFNSVVSEASPSAFPDQLRDAIEFLQRHRSEIARLTKTPGVTEPVLDFGIAQSGIPAQFIRIPLPLIQCAAEIGMSIELSLYAVSKEENDIS
jgi:hypothetical protein